MDVWTNPYRRRWLGWGLLATAFFLVTFHRLSTAVLADDLMRAFDTSGTGLGLLHSSFFYLYALLQVPGGVLADQFGARRTATAGTVIMSVGAVTFGLAPTYAVAFIGRTSVGLGASVLFVSTLRFCANWFRPDEFATMTGVTFTVGILGGLTASTPLAVVASAIGWRPSMAGLGVIGLVIAGGVYLVSYNSPEQAGIVGLEEVPARPSQSFGDLWAYTAVAVREQETWLIGVMMFFMTGIAITIFGLWGVPFLVQVYGITVTEASVYIFIGGIGGLIGPTLFGWLSDWLGRRTELIVVTAVAFAVTWGIIGVIGTPPLVLIAVIFFVSRVLFGGFPLAFTVMKERHPDAASATVVGIVNSMGWIGAAVFPVVLGAVLDAFWTGESVGGTRVYTLVGYRVGFGIAAVAGLIATGCAMWLHRRHTRVRAG